MIKKEKAPRGFAVRRAGIDNNTSHGSTPVARQCPRTATIAILAEKFPAAFSVFQKRRKPLKIGIRQDLELALGDSVDSRKLAKTLRYYTNNYEYLKAIIRGSDRVDLNGNYAGKVTDEERRGALVRLKAFNVRRDARDTERSVPKVAKVPKEVKVAPPPPRPARKGDSFSGLRASWKARRGGGS